jgi:hypothetical protein
MRIRIYSNEIEAPLTAFIGNFLGNVCLGIADSLKTPRPIGSLKFEIEEDAVRLEINGAPVPLDMSQGFSKIIIRDTIRGMIRHLKLADPAGAIRIIVERESQS